MGSYGEEPDIELKGDEAVVLNVGCFERSFELEEDVQMVGMVLANHYVSISDFKNVKLESWKSRNCVEIRHARQNFFTFILVAEGQGPCVEVKSVVFQSPYVGTKCLQWEGRSLSSPTNVCVIMD